MNIGNCFKVDGPVSHGTFYDDDAYPDSHLLLDAEILRRKHDPDFLFVHCMGMDYIGHLYGSNSKEYRQQAYQLDNLLSLYIPQWLNEGYHILVTSDHGMTRMGCMVAKRIEERQVPLFCMSNKIAPGVYPEQVSQMEIAPLICQLLGIEPSEKMVPLNNLKTIGSAGI